MNKKAASVTLAAGERQKNRERSDLRSRLKTFTDEIYLQA